MNPEILDRLPPQSMDAEKSVIGSILHDSDVCGLVCEILQPDDFYADANKRLFRHVVAMCESGKPLDMLLLSNRIAAAGEMEIIGGAAYIGEVLQSVPWAANAMHYASIVARCSKLRKIIHAATDALRDSYDADSEPDKVLASIESDLTNITTGDYRGGPVHISVACMEAVERIDAITQRGQSAGLMTGMIEFDSKYGGLFPGELTILAARPGVGKTSLACQIAQYVAEQNKLVYFASLEMSSSELATRMACTLGEVNSRAVRTGRIYAADSEKLCEATNRLSGCKMYVHNLPGMTISDIRRSSRRFVKDGLSLIVIDYLQLITASDRKLPRHEQIAAMSRELKQLAGELKVPVLCLCQLNREAAKAEKPGLHHLRESGSIEQDADVVSFLHESENGYQWLILKNRNGETGWMPLLWEKQYTRFTSEQPATPSNHEDAFDDYGGN